MRTEEEILNLITTNAIKDEKIRAVELNGSRVTKDTVIDKYSDFDIVYYVTDVREFTKDKSWINFFGDILIVQYPADWYSHPYDYNSNNKFEILVQFSDGNRIDFTITNVKDICTNPLEPRKILLNKDNLSGLLEGDNNEIYNINIPTSMEFDNTCNEFRWLCLYISKGLCRKEFYYAKYIYEVLVIKMFMKMLVWNIGIENSFNINLGSHNKYLKNYLTDDEMRRLQGIFPDGEYDDMWNKLFLMYDYFHELEMKVAKNFKFNYDEIETKKVRIFLENRRMEN